MCREHWGAMVGEGRRVIWSKLLCFPAPSSCLGTGRSGGPAGPAGKLGGVQVGPGRDGAAGFKLWTTRVGSGVSHRPQAVPCLPEPQGRI